MFEMTTVSRGMVCALSMAMLAGCTTPPSQPACDRPSPAIGMEPTAPAAHFPAFARIGGCGIVPQDGRLLLIGPTNDRSLVQTKEEYRPPFVLHLKAKTDTTNIRLYYNAGMVILNWEVRPTELRFHDPINDRITAFSGMGAIDPDKMQNIDWEMYPDGTRVLVNGKEIMRKTGYYGDLSAPVGIGPAFGSVVTVESFTVDKLTGTLEAKH